MSNPILNRLAELENENKEGILKVLEEINIVNKKIKYSYELNYNKDNQEIVSASISLDVENLGKIKEKLSKKIKFNTERIIAEMDRIEELLKNNSFLHYNNFRNFGDINYDILIKLLKEKGYVLSIQCESFYIYKDMNSLINIKVAKILARKHEKILSNDSYVDSDLGEIVDMNKLNEELKKLDISLEKICNSTYLIKNIEKNSEQLILKSSESEVK